MRHIMFLSSCPTKPNSIECDDKYDDTILGDNDKYLQTKNAYVIVLKYTKV